LYGSETYFTLSEEHGLKVLEHKLLGRIFRPMKEEVNWRIENIT
jgi:hypothetical protein